MDDFKRGDGKDPSLKMGLLSHLGPFSLFVMLQPKVKKCQAAPLPHTRRSVTVSAVQQLPADGTQPDICSSTEPGGTWVLSRARSRLNM